MVAQCPKIWSPIQSCCCRHDPRGPWMPQSGTWHWLVLTAATPRQPHGRLQLSEGRGHTYGPRAHQMSNRHVLGEQFRHLCKFPLANTSVWNTSSLIQFLFDTQFSSVHFSSVPQSCPTLCDPMNRSTPGLPVHHQLPEITQTHVHRVHDAIQPSHPGSSLSPPAPNLSQHQMI